ncbi:MAG TPA: hypothetical protein VH478_14060, partial [Trebonia sp.]|nr:hypothetical protein [Trebonia sp.]
RGHGEAALSLVRDALRYNYLAENIPGIAVACYNLGNYLHLYARQPGRGLACHLAAGLIRTLIGITGGDRGSDTDSVRQAASGLHVLGPAAEPPASVAELGAQVGDIPGTDLPGLIAQVCPDPERAETALRDLVRRAVALATEPEPAEEPDA